MTRFDVRFTIWGNAIEASVFADDEKSAADAVERHYGFMDDGSFSIRKEKEDGRRRPVVIYC